jgi:hypothetical protein
MDLALGKHNEKWPGAWAHALSRCRAVNVFHGQVQEDTIAASLSGIVRDALDRYELLVRPPTPPPPSATNSPSVAAQPSFVAEAADDDGPHDELCSKISFAEAYNFFNCDSVPIQPAELPEMADTPALVLASNKVDMRFIRSLCIWLQGQFRVGTGHCFTNPRHNKPRTPKCYTLGRFPAWPAPLDLLSW